MTHHRATEGKKKKVQKRVRKRQFKVKYGSRDLKEPSSQPKSIIAHGKFIDGRTGYQAIFLKSVWSTDSMGSLSEFLLDYTDAWQFRQDHARGPKYFFITGRWCAQGHFRPGIDKTYLAGNAGKCDVPEGFPEINLFVKQWGVEASLQLRKYRPDLIPALDLLPEDEKIFGDFPLFMAARGVAKLHTDMNDVVSVLFLMKGVPNCGGGLEIGGADIVFEWEIGDIIILDSADLVHGTREYGQDIDSRIVGIFILHKSMLRICDIEIP